MVRALQLERKVRMPRMSTLVFAVAAGAVVALLIVAASTTGCSPAQVEKVKDVAATARSERDVVCGFIERAAAADDRLVPALQACEAGKTLEEVAAVYAGCE